MTLKEEKQLKNMIKELVREAVFNEMDNFQQQFPIEAKKKDNNDESEDQNDRYGQDNAVTTRSHAVIQKLKDPSTNNAEVMRQLWHPNKDEEDEKRSLFSKKVRHAENDNGSKYAFTTDEMNHLYQILSNGSI